MQPGTKVKIVQVPHIYRRELKRGMEGIYVGTTTDELNGQLFFVRFEGWHTSFPLRAEEFTPADEEEDGSKLEHPLEKRIAWAVEMNKTNGVAFATTTEAPND